MNQAFSKEWMAELFARERRAQGRLGDVDRCLELAVEFPSLVAMADTALWRDMRPTWLANQAPAAVTLTATAKALWPVVPWSSQPVNYWTAGKVVKITAYGRITTAATPGNGTASMAYGQGDNPATIKSSTAKALLASQTAATWRMEGYWRCDTIGTTGTLYMAGRFETTVGVMASTVAPQFIPDSANADVTVDTTVVSGISFQYARSGSTVETMQTDSMFYEALN